MSQKPRLRIVTYMCPSHPVELYELIMQYLEEELKSETYLIYESRNSGPLLDRVDPFTSDTADVAFMSPSAFWKIHNEKNKYAELLPVTAVFAHPSNVELTKGYYSDIIIHIDNIKHVKKFIDLRGCRWAYSSDNSLSGCAVILKTLRELGENATFFGDAKKSGSHLNSIHMVLTKQAQAAAVDATTLSYNKKFLPDGGKDVIVLQSIGPLPAYPVIVNSRLDRTLKEKIMTALLAMADKASWGRRLKEYGVQMFVPNSSDAYDQVRELESSVKRTILAPCYY